MPNGAATVHLDIPSIPDMVELAQAAAEHVGRTAGFDDDTLHWVGMSVRECVINAIVHGNGGDPQKRVYLDFTSTLGSDRTELSVCVRDEGNGFDPAVLKDPLAPEHILQQNGRGIFLMRSFMDSVSLERAPEGGMQIRMVKTCLRDHRAGATRSSSEENS